MIDSPEVSDSLAWGAFLRALARPLVPFGEFKFAGSPKSNLSKWLAARHERD